MIFPYPPLPTREPELFQLDGAPTELDEATNSVVAGADRLKLFKGAAQALLELSTQERFAGTKVAVASATSRMEWALECLRLLQVETGVVTLSALVRGVETIAS